MSKESLSGVNIIMPTQESMMSLDILLGPAKAEFDKAGVTVHTLIEYCVNQWAAYKFDEDTIVARSRSLLSAVMGTAMVDFSIENSMAYQDEVDRTLLGQGIRAVVYYVFKDIIPLIEELGMTPEEMYGVSVVNWLGQDVVIRAERNKHHCSLTNENNLNLIDILEQGDF